MIPAEVMDKARHEAAVADIEGKIQTRAGVAIVLASWAIGAALMGFLVYRYVSR